MFMTEKPMNHDNPLHQLITSCFEFYGKNLNPQVFETWALLLAEFDYQDIHDAFIAHMKTNKFPPTAAEIIGLLTDLGHPDPELAWQLCPKSELDCGYVTNEIMMARAQCQDAIENGDRTARNAFLEVYGGIMTQCRRCQIKPVWFYSDASGGTSENRALNKLNKTLEAAQWGRISRESARRSIGRICKQLNQSCRPYLKQLLEIPTTRQTTRISKNTNPVLSKT
jgi:hypothetical protein